jgi:hypothetical protein
MTSRRTFLQTGFAASLLLPGTNIDRRRHHPEAATSQAPSNVNHLYKVVADVRFSQALAFALAAEHLGADVVRIDGDITDFWFHDLSLRWQERPVAVGGLTAHGPLFCLERLGWDHGLRVVFRGRHGVNADGDIEHAISGPHAVASARSLALAGPDWAPRAARLITASEIGHPVGETVVPAVSSTRPPGDATEPLVSWVIAPLGDV